MFISLQFELSIIHNKISNPEDFEFTRFGCITFIFRGNIALSLFAI